MLRSTKFRPWPLILGVCLSNCAVASYLIGSDGGSGEPDSEQVDDPDEAPSEGDTSSDADRLQLDTPDTTIPMLT